MREDSPQGRDSAETSGAVTVPAIVILLAIGLVLRLIIAYVLLPGSGFPNDLSTFQAWGNDVALHGPIGFYDRQSFIDYPPVYLLALGLLGLVTNGAMGEGVKLIPILADAVLAFVVWQMVVDLGGSGRRAFIAMIVVLINPITWFNSAIWGQADAFGAILLLLSLREIQHDRRETASALAVLATLTKLQLGIVGFVVGFVVLRRSLAPRDGEADPVRVLTSVGAGLLAAAAVCLPFTGLDFPGIVHRLGTVPGLATFAVGAVAAVGVFFLARRAAAMFQTGYETAIGAGLAVATLVGFSAMVFDSIVSHVVSTFGEYPYLTLNAYNPWALFADDSGRGMGRVAGGGGLSWLQDSPWTDQGGASQPGYHIGPFSATVTLEMIAVAGVMLVVAFAVWTMNRARVPAAIEAGDPATEPDDAEAGGPAGDWTPRGVAARFTGAVRAEIRGLPAILVVLAGLIGFVLIAQIAGGLTAAAFGDGLLIIAIVGVSAWAAWRDDSRSLLVALAILAIAFFIVPTRVHERYLFPFFGLGAILLAVSWRWTVAYVALAIANTANLLAVLVQYQGIPDKDGSLAKMLNDWGTWMLQTEWPAGILVVVAGCAIVTGLAMVWALLQMRGRAVDALARETEAAYGDEEARLPRPLRWLEPPASGYAAGGYVPTPGAPGGYAPARFAAGGPAASGGEPDAGAGEPSMGMSYPAPEPDGDYYLDDEEPFDEEETGPRPVLVPRFVMRLWRWVYRPSSQPDRSAALDKEKRGRFDKLDVWILVALVVATLSLRVYRLDEPTKMYFDEVYHARTATEFLQDWRYGIPHDIYEWTHPHFAKYAIAAGITLFSDDQVKATSELGVTVKDAVVEPRILPSTVSTTPEAGDPRTSPDARDGDRIFIATGSEVRSYDMSTRALEYTYEIPGASSLDLIASTGQLYVGTTDGRIFRIDVNSLDDVRLGSARAPAAPVELSVQTGISITHIYAGTPPVVLVSDAAGNVVSVDLDGQTGETISAKALIAGAADFVDFGTGPGTVSFTPTQLTDPKAEAQVLATAIFGSVEADIEAQLRAGVSSEPVPLTVSGIDSTAVSKIQTAITANQLPGVTVTAADPEVLVAYTEGVGVLDALHLNLTSTLATDQPATSIAVPDTDSQPTFVAAGDSIDLITLDSSAGTVTMASPQPLSKMPGPVTKVAWDEATHIAQALGRTPDGKGWTLYSIDSTGDALGNNVFDDAPLPFEPVAIGLDSTPDQPQTDREQMVAIAADGSMASVDVGQFAFSWRIMGVLFGTLMAACLYLLARLLFKRRSVGLLVAFFTVIDGMFFVQSRIAMNDTYVGGLLLLAYLIFALLWLGVWKNRFAFWLGMPALGVVLGLALFSKWVAAYAVASIGILILIRSALGRLITILGLAGATGVLGYMALGEMQTTPNTGNMAVVVGLLLAGIAVALAGLTLASRYPALPDKLLVAGVSLAAAVGLGLASLLATPETIQNGAPNYTYFLIMLGITSIAAAANAYHPVAWSREEYYFAIGAPLVAGVLGLFFAGLGVAAFGYAVSGGAYVILGLTFHISTLLEVGIGGVVTAGAVVLAALVAGELGFGPLAKEPLKGDPAALAEPPTPAPTGWLRLGTGFGLPAVWMIVSLLILPLAIYIAMYIPWSMPWQQEVLASPTVAAADVTGPLPVIWCFHYDTVNNVCDQAFPAGHTGSGLESLWDLTQQMYTYHNDLRQAHPAASPWWAWPLDLKPVWFESISYGPDTGSWIHDGGNLALWWMAIFGMIFVCWQAFKRRSLGLTLVAVAFFWQWLSWSRIDRASFQYHFYTALPFFLLGLAYFVAELWHGPSRKTWLLARVAAAVCFLFPAALWIFKAPLCGIARVDATAQYSSAICGTGTGSVVLQGRHVLIGIVLLIALAVLAFVLIRAERRQDVGQDDNAWIVQLIIPVVIAGAALWLIGQYGPTATVFQADLPADSITLIALALGVAAAPIVLASRNPRRFVLGLCIFALVTFLALYPDLSALPIPNAIMGPYQGALPTWFYGFQFSVNQQVSSPVKLFGLDSLSLAAVALILAAIVGWAAWERRVLMGMRLRGAEIGIDDGELTTDLPSGAEPWHGATPTAQWRPPSATASKEPPASAPPELPELPDQPEDDQPK